MNKTRTRRQRRQFKASLRHGKSAKPKHMLRSGRTGKVFTVHLKSLKAV